MMLRMGGGVGEGSDYGSSDAGSYEYDDEAEEDYEEELDHHLRVHHHEHPVGEGAVEGQREGDGGDGSEYDEEGFDEEYEEEVGPELDPAEYEDDEAYARALQDAEEREVASRLMALAGISDWRGVEPDEEHVNDPQDAWQEVDPDEYSYEELVALGEVVGTQNRGLSADILASLPSLTFKAKGAQDGNSEQCVICRVEFEDGESLIALPCKHSYHPECINQWLQINKVCPMCSSEVSTSDNKQA
uniref:RING-type domain-containing protein n=2 Tax=Oryza brachyantha TaxID=4533 RepID=J3MZJ2_ORYBR